MLSFKHLLLLFFIVISCQTKSSEVSEYLLSANFIKNEDDSLVRILDKAKELYSKGKLYHSNKNDSLALIYYFQCYDLCKGKAELEDKIVGVLLSIAEVYENDGQWMKSIECYNKCIGIIEEKDTPEKAAILNKIGNVFFNIGLLDSSEIYFKKCLSLYIHLDDSVNISYIYNNIGNVSLQKGDYQSALENYFSSIKYKEQLNRISQASSTYSNIASVYEKMDRPLKALEYFQYSYQIDHDADNRQGCAADLINMGNVHLNLNQYKDALSCFNEAQTISYDIQYNYGLANSIEGVSLVYSATEEYDSALLFLNKALLYKKKIGRPSELANSYNNLGSLFFYENRYSDAISAFSKSIELARVVGDVEKEKRALSGLHESHSRIGDYKSAYAELLEHKILEDSIVGISKSKQIFELQEKYESDKKEQQIKIQKLEIKRKETQRNLFFAIAVFVLITAFYISWLIVQKKKKVQLLFEKEKEIQKHQLMRLVQESEIKSSRMMLEGQELEKERVSKELHDRVGGLLSLLKLRFSACRDFIQKDKEAAFNESIQLLDSTYHEVRNFSHELSGALISKFGLSVALKEMQKVINNSGVMTFRLTINEKPIQRDHFLELSLYRIIQELISNILKHAKANCIDVLVNLNRNDNWEIVVEDNGVGFDYETKIPDGLGLVGIQDRVEHLKAKLSIESAIGKGTKVSIQRKTDEQ